MTKKSSCRKRQCRDDVELSKRADGGDGGVLIDNGTHTVDIVRCLIGLISHVSVVQRRRIQDLDEEDTVNISMRIVDDVFAKVNLSWSINKALDDYIRVFGANGAIQVGWRDFRHRQASNSDSIVFGSGYGKRAAFRRRLGNFCARVLGLESLPIGSRDAVASVEVTRAACDSPAGGQWVTIDSSYGRPGALGAAATRPAG